jgi:two-component system, LytTR family, response regulator
MKALIVDDERLARSEFKNLIKKHKEIEIVAEKENGEDALEYLKNNKVDVVFLDMEMPEMKGTELAEKIDEDTKIVFVTAHEEYAIDAFELNAIDYLLKPIDPKKLEKTVFKLKEIVKEEDEERKKILSISDKIFIKDGNKCWYTELSKVRVFQSEGNYTKVLYDKQKQMVLRSLNALEERLDKNHFFRANRKFIININHIERIESWFNGGLVAIMEDESKIEISRRQAVKFKNRFSL